MKKLVANILVATVLLSGFTVSAIPQNAHAKAFTEQKQTIERYVVGVGQGSPDIELALGKVGGKVVEEWSFINTYLIEIDPQNAERLNEIPGVVFANPEAVVTENAFDPKTVDSATIANAYNSAVLADRVWARGITGNGVTVAVVDSGVNYGRDRSDFSDRIIKNLQFSTSDYNADTFGHGTHVASVLGGDGSQSAGKYPGIAPGVNIINVKVSDHEGKTGEKNLVQGLQWIYENHKNYNIRVVNISNQISTRQNYKESATNAAVELLWKEGIVVVVSAGNQGGTRCSTCYAPANDPFVITVGAVDDNGTKNLDDDSSKSWSSQGMTSEGFAKPELMAPGSGMIAYMPRGSLRQIKPENVVENEYFEMGGTSMSAPVVSGVVALMLEANPRLTPDQVKWILTNTTRSYIDQPARGAGIVRADAAVFYNPSKIPADVGQKHEMSPLITSETNNEISWSNISWRNMSWSNISWRNNYFD